MPDVKTEVKIERRFKVNDLRLTGASVYKISKALNVSFVTVRSDFRYLEKQEAKLSDKMLTDQKKVEIDLQLQKQINKAYKLMQDSLAQGEKTKTKYTGLAKKGEKANITPVEVEKETYLPNYNAAIGFQRNMLDAIQKRMALWGTDTGSSKGVKVEVNNNIQNNKIDAGDLSKNMNEKELGAVDAVLAQVLERKNKQESSIVDSSLSNN